ncbi:hypothetical protein FCIRC_6174 [Fusarium circinatum]|uniref:Uncharacterized protein n=1 Tax=Fusarium circinatum TaxID=48490 RepID=A0A8H5TVW5_FUSCI|nr:hypothetical protein FCIRC_6174 [Fusarium circinatum]
MQTMSWERPKLPPYTSRVADFTGLYQQHLRDLMVWVENIITPPTPTNYTVVERQVEVTLSASVRKGIQPVVELFVDDSKRTQSMVGWQRRKPPRTMRAALD